jgi:putative ABC transport system permease protein
MSDDAAPAAPLQGRLIAWIGSSLRTAIVAVGHNKLRAALTSLGILFGVASVIAMLAIGKGAEQEILEQMRLLGTNNILVTPLVEQKEEAAKDDDGRKEVKRFTPGLTWQDAQAIQRTIPEVDIVSAEVVLNSLITREGRRRTGKVVGVDTAYFRLTNLDLAQGEWFNRVQVTYGRPVAIIGHGIRSRFFTTEDPIGKALKAGDTWLTVVGVLKDRPVSQGVSERLGVRDPNMDVYVPLPTMLARYRNRARVTQTQVERAAREFDDNPAGQQEEPEDVRTERLNYHQLDRIVVRAREARFVPPVAEILQRMLSRRHNTVVDFEITVPELLLQQEQRTKNIFNIVLGAIASISLIVGGIGIMNIMLASVLERIREIGVRRAVGATRANVLSQFLAEAVLISVAGGLAGIVTGVAISYGIEQFAGIRTLVSGVSVVVAFGVSLTVGLVFGIVPAYRAANQDPVTCLRYE